MAKQIVPNTGRDIIVSMNYDPTGKEWVELFDNVPLGWGVDDADLSHPEPVVVGSLPPAAADTAPILSPQWAQYTGGYAVVPDLVRLSLPDFFSWLATNNGASRQVRSSMKSTDLANAYFGWSGGAGASSSAAAAEASPPVEGAFGPGHKANGETGQQHPEREHREGERRDRQGEHREGEQHRDEARAGDATRHTTAVEPMKSTDLGEEHARSSQEQHRGSPGKPHEAKSPPHPSAPRR